MRPMILLAVVAWGLSGMACSSSTPAPVPTPIVVTPPPTAHIIDVLGTLNGTPQSDGTYSFTPTGKNDGDGCAGSVSGTSTFRATAGLVKAIPWSLPAGTIVRPGATFIYSLCCLTKDEAFAPGITGGTAYTYLTVPCP